MRSHKYCQKLSRNCIQGFSSEQIIGVSSFWLSQVLRHRKSLKLSRAQVEYLTNGAIKQSWLAHFENGLIKHPDKSKMELLAQALGVTMFALYQESGFIEANSSAVDKKKNI